MGAILTQGGGPIAYYSEALKGSALHLSTYDKEMLAIVKAVRKWRPYLLGKPFVIQIDQRSLKFLLGQRISTLTQIRWLPKLLGYDYIIRYKRGEENKGADALSRRTILERSAISLPIVEWWQQLRTEVRSDKFYDDWYAGFSLQQQSRYVFRDGLWYKQGVLFLSPNSSLIPDILIDAHASPI